MVDVREVGASHSLRRCGISDPVPIRRRPQYENRCTRPDRASRGTVNEVFTPRRVRSLEGQFRDRITTLIDGVAERGGCDLIADLASPLVVHMTGDLLGVPVPTETTHRLGRALSFPDDAELHNVECHDVIAKGGAFLMGFLQQRLEDPREDLITALGAPPTRGRPCRRAIRSASSSHRRRHRQHPAPSWATACSRCSSTSTRWRPSATTRR